MNEVRTIIIHHSASSRDSTSLEKIDAWHRDRGFDEIGYHFVIEGGGELRHGRALPRDGAHAPPNPGRIGICITGNNTQRGEEWSIEQLLSARVLIGALRTVWPGLPVEGHRDVMREGYTACPGVDIGELFE